MQRTLTKVAALLFSIGAVVEPLLATQGMGVLGLSGLYVFSSAVHLLLFGFVGICAFKPLLVPLEQRSSFGEALTSTQTAADIYAPKAKNVDQLDHT
ncbi:MAG: hypothetical protein RBR02_10210 [Desulfuromonadaceae bacterium]|nr:hypothetical protein [Desulfuromonadaceae bacterium]